MTDVTSTHDEPPAIVTDALSIRRGGMWVLRDVGLTCGPGLFHLRGDNGAGKSSLLRALAGVLRVAAGRVRIAGHDLEREPVEARRQLGYMPDSADLFPYLRCDELLDTVASLRGASPALLAEARASLEPLEIAALTRARIGTLSFGQRRKLALAAALCGRPRVLLLDEPHSGLDAHARAFLNEQLARAAAEGRTVVIASHRAQPTATAVLTVARHQVSRASPERAP